MAIKWLKTSELAALIEDHFELNTQQIREMCESGIIPPRFAKRPPGKERGHWKIAVKGLRFILEKVLELEPEEVAEVAKKAPVNFRRAAA